MQNHRQDVEAYMDGVLDGMIPAGRLVKLAVERQRQDEANAESRGFYFDEKSANLAIAFASICCHSKGEWAGESLVLEPWQKFCDWCVFGWRRTSDGTRRFRKEYREVARKNGKSTDTARKGLQLLCFDDEPGAEVYVAATKEDQANIIHLEATRMVKQSTSLRKLCSVLKKNIACESFDSYFRPIGSDSDKTDGLNPHGVLKDELHAWRERHRGLHEKLSTGGASRRQPLEVIITTAGDDESTIWMEERDYARRVVESAIYGEVINDALFAFIACIDDEDKETIERLFDSDATEPPRDIMAKANPNLGVSVKWDYLVERFVEAKGKPTSRNSFLRYHCNVKVSSTEKAISPETWSACKGVVSPRDNAVGYGAWDLGRSNDLASVGLLFPEGDTVRIMSQSWTCEETQAFPLDMEPWKTYVRMGWLKVSRGSAVDYNEVEQHILDWHRRYDVRSWAYDPTFAKQLAQRLEDVHGLPAPFSFTQKSFHYNEPTRKFLQALAERRVIHDGNPMLAYQADSLTIARNARDEWMPDKSIGKIDAMVAIIMAYSEYLFSQEGSSIYSEPAENWGWGNG